VIALATDTRADVDALAAKVEAAGGQIVHAPRDLTTPGGGYGFRFFSPDGLQMEISADVARGQKREIERWEGVPVKISHIVLHSPNHKALVEWFCDVLGFKVSDWLGDFMCFLRCNNAHHRFAILPGPACLNHVAYDMEGVDGMMRGGPPASSRALTSAGVRAATPRATTRSAISSRRAVSSPNIPPSWKRWTSKPARPRFTPPRPWSWTNGALAWAGRRPCRIRIGLFVAVEA
jgi:catechol 2,3-dioxygenase-like lactoylglutathione lyase family enzyme